MNKYIKNKLTSLPNKKLIRKNWTCSWYHKVLY